MAHPFSSSDLDGLAKSVELLSSPLDHDSVDAWRAGVNRHLEGLLRADTAGFLLPVPDAVPLYSEGHDPAELARFTDYPPPPTVGGKPVWERLLHMRVITLESVYGSEYDRYLRSTYYNEYAAPNGAHDTLAMAMSLGGTDPSGSAALHFWHSDPRGRRFGEREVSMLRVLYPAFETGVRTVVRTVANQVSMKASLDGRRDGALLYDNDGTLLHRTPRLPALAVTSRAERALIRAGREMALALAGRDPSELLAAGAVSRTVRLRPRAFELSAVAFGEGVFTHRPGVLVTVAAGEPALPSPRVLQERFGLTRRQAEVALLLARRKTNPEIARMLCISPHTTRHHAAAAMGKLGVRDRRQVEPLLRAL